MNFGGMEVIVPKLDISSWGLQVNGDNIGLYFGGCLLVGLDRFGKIDTPRKFALVFGNLPNIILTCVVFATTIGAGTILGATKTLYSLELLLALEF